MRLNNLSRWSIQMRNVHYWLLLIGMSWAGAIAACVLIVFILRMLFRMAIA